MNKTLVLVGATIAMAVMIAAAVAVPVSAQAPPVNNQQNAQQTNNFNSQAFQSNFQNAFSFICSFGSC